MFINELNRSICLQIEVLPFKYKAKKRCKSFSTKIVEIWTKKLVKVNQSEHNIMIRNVWKCSTTNESLAKRQTSNAKSGKRAR